MPRTGASGETNPAHPLIWDFRALELRGDESAGEGPWSVYLVAAWAEQCAADHLKPSGPVPSAPLAFPH